MNEEQQDQPGQAAEPANGGTPSQVVEETTTTERTETTVGDVAGDAAPSDAGANFGEGTGPEPDAQPEQPVGPEDSPATPAHEVVEEVHQDQAANTDQIETD